ncbi:hypothetical protein [Glaciecola petra]|uniref:Uncharacterized protein n=1 Tax=Glaciecola petra TaxID=3075602 RepID=A0ABU2ZSH2_9ALTE|nr:hypothetical protein [Aestuariibacter sp. P117]MDT0595576.1 hypothetical protein [Aestuariibacter sp. P117]
MIIEILKATVIAALPVFILTYLLVSKVAVTGKLNDPSGKQSLKKAMKNMKTDRKNTQKKEGQEKLAIGETATNKWLFFGGGFYGLVAFGTYVFIEVGEIGAFLFGLIDFTWAQFWSQLSIDLLINFIINSVMNLVDAFVWFRYWPQVISMQNGWIWLIVAYLGYVLAAQIATNYPMRFSISQWFTHKFK